MRILLILSLVLSGAFAPAIGGQDVEALLKRLESSDTHVRDAAVAVIAKLGPGKLDAIAFQATLFLAPRFKKLNDEGKMFGDDPVLQRILGDLGRALATMGPAAVDALAAWAISGRLSLESDLSFRALEIMGPRANGAIPTLKTAMYSDDSDFQWGGMVGLALVDGPDYPNLKEAFRSPNTDLRALAVYGFGKSKSAAVVDLVLEAISDPDMQVSGAASMAMRDLGPLLVPKIPEILSIKNQEFHAPFEAMGETAVPPLKDLLLKGQSPICDRAGVALARAGGPALPALTDALGRPDPAVRRAAVSALPEVDGNKKFIADSLAIAWKDGDSSVREAALASLSATGDEGERLVPMFTAGLKDASAPERIRSAMALAKLGRHAGSSASVLTAALADSEGGVRSAAAQALGLVGADPAGAVPKLLSLIKEPMAEVRQGAVFALGALESGSIGLKAILQALEDTDREVALEGVRSLWRFGSEGQIVKPVLLRQLKSSDKDFCLAALETLHKLGGLSEAKAGLLSLLKSPDKDLRYAAIDGIYRIGHPPEAKPLLEELQKKEPDQEVRVKIEFVLEGYREDLTIPLPPPPPPMPGPQSAPMFRKPAAIPRRSISLAHSPVCRATTPGRSRSTGPGSKPATSPRRGCPGT